MIQFSSLSKREDSLEFVYFLVALSLFLSVIELSLPRPIPFFRLGLANLPLLLALPLLQFREFFLLAILKSLGSSFLGGTLFSYLFLLSISGTIASALVMFFLYRFLSRYISIVAISFAGAFVHTSVQVLMAGFLIFGESAYYFFLPMLIIGQISSVFLGVFAATINLSNISSYSFNSEFEDSLLPSSFFYRLGIMLFFIALLFSFISLPSSLYRFIGMSLLLFLSLIFSKSIKPLLFSTITFLFIFISNLFVPLGEVFFVIGNFNITEGAFSIGVGRASLFVGLIALSRLLFFSGLFSYFSYGKLGEVFIWYRRIWDEPEAILSLLYSNEIEKSSSFLLNIVGRVKGKRRNMWGRLNLPLIFLLILLLLLFGTCIFFNSVVK